MGDKIGKPKNGRQLIAIDGEYLCASFDPCNNPSDAWTIILKNEISLNSRCANGEWKAQIFIRRNDIVDEYASCWDKNPLRAAMIVFLMMQEEQP